MGNRPAELQRAARLGGPAGRRPGRGRRGRQRRAAAADAARGRAHRRAAREPGHPRRPQRRHRGLRPRRRDVDALLFLDDDGLLPAHRHRRAAPRRPSPPTRARHRQLPDRRPRDRRHPAPPRAAAARRATRCAPRGSPPSWAAPARSARAVFAAGRRAAGRVLLRPRGDRPGLAGAGRGLVHPLRRGPRAAPPGDLPRPGTRSTTG